MLGGKRREHEPGDTPWCLFQLMCLVLGGEDEQALRAVSEADLLAELVAMAASHDVLPALAIRTGQLADQRTSDIALPWQNSLTAALLENTRRNMQVLLQSLKLARALNCAGIEPLMLKGTAYLLTINSSNMGFRKQADIDLIVPPDQQRRACEVLVDNGYAFCELTGREISKRECPTDISAALRRGASHHHLPALSRDGYIATVELHSHHLPRRFQVGNPVTELFEAAASHEKNGARFLIPSIEHQIIHLVLGGYVHDGWQTRQLLPIRQACDFIGLSRSIKSSVAPVNPELLRRRCGSSLTVFAALVHELMAYTPAALNLPSANVGRSLALMRARYNSRNTARALDAIGRLDHLASTALSNPAKFPAYLSRLASPGLRKH